MENILKIREQVRKLTMNISLGFMEYKELQPIVNEISKLTDEEVSIQKCALEEIYERANKNCNLGVVTGRLEALAKWQPSFYQNGHEIIANMDETSNEQE